MSDTPRTDKAHKDWLECASLGGKVIADNAAEFARQLERELAEAVQANIKANEIIEQWRLKNTTYLQERDRLRAELEAANNECSVRNDEVSGLTAQFAELRADKARLDWLDSKGVCITRPTWDILLVADSINVENIRTAIDAAMKGT